MGAPAEPQVNGRGVVLTQHSHLLVHDLLVGLVHLLIGAAGGEAIEPRPTFGIASMHGLPVEHLVDHTRGTDQRLHCCLSSQRAVQVEVDAHNWCIRKLFGGRIDLFVLG